MKTDKKPQSWLHLGTIRLARLHFLFVALLAIQTVMYDAWKLITPTALLNRWVVTAGLMIVTTTTWYLAKNTVRSTLAFKALIWALITADIAVASFNVYTQRGMASRAVALYTLPIIISAVLLSRAALFTAAALSAAAYSSTAIAYFVLNFNEGYKIELYGEVGFYAVLFFVLASLLWIAIRSREKR